MLLDDDLQARVRRNLDQFQRCASDPESGSPAAVALVLLPDEGGRACFALTRRSGGLRNHAGQFALPGGRLEPGEDAVQAALRELDEELGVSLAPQTVLGCLDDFVTRSGFVITPVVAWAAHIRSLAPDPDEVAVAYRIPLAELYDPRVPVLWNMPGAEAGGEPCLSLPLLGTHIHSPTAAIIFQLREVALEGRATRVGHFEQPRFAWK